MQANIHFQSVKSLTVKEDVMRLLPDASNVPFHAWLTLEDSEGGSIVIHVHDVETLDKLAFHATALARSIRNAKEYADNGVVDPQEQDVPFGTGGADYVPVSHLIEEPSALDNEPIY
jgi:hypothetical protein